MINCTTFCPFERIIAKFKIAGINLKATHLSIMFDGYGRRTYDLTTKEGKSVYFAGGFSVADRKHFMQQKENTGSIVLTTKDGSVVKPFVVKHCLYKVPHFLINFKGKGPVESSVGDIKTFHREALEINVASAQLTPASGKLLNDFVPFYNYVIVEPTLSKDTIEIYGPACLTEMEHVFTMKETELAGSVEVYSNEIQPLEIKADVEKPDGVVDELVRNLVYFEYFNTKEPVQVLQRPMLLTGHKLQPDDYLKSLKIASYIEYCAVNSIPVDGLDFKDEHFVIALELLGGSLVLDRKAQVFYHEHVKGSEFVNEIFNNLIATEDGLLVNNTVQPVYISALSSSAACFANSFSFFISQITGGSVFTQLSSLSDLIREGGLEVVFDDRLKKHILQGNSDKFWNGEKRFIKTIYGGVSVSGHLTRQQSIINGCDGFVIVGFDPFVSSVDGVDHYVVAIQKSGRLYLYYDPMRYFGDNYKLIDITDKFLNTPASDRVVYYFDKCEICRGDTIREAKVVYV